MRFKILQWNCMYSEDIEKIANFVNKLQPDIVCLQELTKGYHTTHSDTGSFLANTMYNQCHYSYGSMTLPDGTQAQMGMGIFSRYPLKRQRKIILQEGVTSTGKVLQDERFYLQASVKLGHSELTIGTTHLPFHPRFQTTPLKQGMVEAILRHIPKRGSYILAGDLNTTPRTKAAKTFRRHGLKNAGPSFDLPTWTTKPFSIGSWSYQELKWRLDYVLYTGSLRSVSSEVVATELSDHLPILSEFELKK